MTSSRTLLKALVAGLVFISPVAAQKTPPGLAAGAIVSGTLGSGDPTAADGSYYELWAVRASAGEVLTITMTSSAFDAYLAIGRMSGGEFESLDTDDDGAGGTDARIVFTAPRTGEYLVRANTLSEGETGSYRLSLGSSGGGESITSTSPQLLTPGEPVSGRLSTTDPKLDDDTYYDAYRFQGRAGQRVTITMRAPDFDAYLSLGRGSGDDYESIESDDDGAGGTDARLEITLPATGQYEVRANALSVGQTGAYSLLLDTGGGEAASADRTAADLADIPAIAMGQALTGELTTGDARFSSEGSYFDGYRFSGRAGQQVTLTMRSGAFDAALFLLVFRNDTSELLAQDHDSAGGTDARLVFTLPETGTYLIAATTSGPGTGGYSLDLSAR